MRANGVVIQDDLFRRGREIAILVLGGVIACSSLYMITGARVELYFQSIHASLRPQAGMVLRSRSDVRRRIGDDVQWLTLPSGSRLYLEDRIFTGAESTAEIELPDGSRLELSPETLIVLRRSGDEDWLELSRGAILGTLGSREEWVVSRGGSAVRITGTTSRAKVEIRAEEGHPFHIRPLEGQVRLASLSELSIAVKSQSPAASPPSPKPLTEVPRLTSPLDGSRFSIGELDSGLAAGLGQSRSGLIIPLTWQATLGARRYELQIGLNSAFQGSVFKRTLPGSGGETPRLLAGTYYWRVRVAARAPEAQAPWSKVFRFRIEPTGVPLPEAPILSAVPAHRQWVLVQGRALVDLTWKGLKGTRAYRLEIARRPDFGRDSIVTTQKVSGTSYRGWVRRAGTYYWRVRAVKDTGEVSAFSMAGRFEVSIRTPRIPKRVQEFQGAFLTPRPTPSGPDSMLGWVGRALDLLVPNAEAAGTDGPVLEWEAIPEAREYRLEISETSDFRNISLRESSRANRFEWVKYRPGTFYWRVSAVDETGKVTLPSQPAMIRIRIAAPRLDPHPDLNETTPDREALNAPFPETQLVWSQDQVYHSYEVELSEDPEFRAPGKWVSKVNHLNFRPLHPGTYYWRVRKVAADQSPISPCSATGSFRAIRTLRVPEPEAATQVQFHPWTLSGTLGAAWIGYRDSWITGFSEVAWMAKVSATRNFAGSPWTIRGELEGTPVSLAKDQPTTARYLSWELLGNRELGGTHSPWKLELAAGVSYLTLFTSPEAFGFTNLAGLELQPAVKRRLAEGSSVSLHVKAVAPAHFLSFYPISNRELGTGAAYVHPLAGTRELSLSLDLTWVDLLLQRGPTHERIVSMGVGYGL